MVNPTPPQASFPIPPPLAKLPIGHINPQNQTEVLASLQYLKFIQQLWAGVQGDGGLTPRVDVLEQEVAIIFGMHGDGTLSPTGVLTVTKTNGVAFGPFATGTDGGNLTANSVPYAKLVNAAGPELLGADAAGPIGAITIGAGLSLAAGVLSATGSAAPSTRQVLLATGTYTTPAGCTQLRIRMVGGGGGGGGATANGGTVAGSNGGTTAFDTGGTNYRAAGGGGGNLDGGASGTGGTGGTSPNTIRFQGNGGTAGVEVNAGFVTDPQPGIGGASPFGGVHYTSHTSGAGGDAAANSGSGGGGGLSGVGPTNLQAAGGGGSGEYVEIIINGPAASYAFTIGAGGAGGVTTCNGGAGADGIIIVDEVY